MNQDTIKLVTAKIEKTLEMVRVLKSEKAGMEATIQDLRENLQAKDKEIEAINNSKEQLFAEIRSLNDSLKERDLKLQDSETAILQALEVLDNEVELSKNEKSNNEGFI